MAWAFEKVETTELPEFLIAALNVGFPINNLSVNSAGSFTG